MANTSYILRCIASLGLLLSCLLAIGRADVVNLDDKNIENILKTNELVFVNFYADWCHFSQMLAPIFEEAEKKAKETFPGNGQVALAKVDCDRETGIAQKYHVSKYPTLKLFRHGEVMKREYRGQRSADGMVEFLQDQMNDRIKTVNSVEDMKFENDKRYIVGHFFDKNTDAYKTFKKVASQHRDDCSFVLLDKSKQKFENLYAKNGADEKEISYTGNLTNFDAVLEWARSRCVPLVRKITFANAEELTEEGLPFLLLFTKNDDKETPKLYEEAVKRELMTQRTSVNILTGDGEMFSHPLHHLGKSVNDLPVLCIDSFRHMFLYPKDTKSGLTKPGELKKFVEDLHSGKLHREFHNGPDPEPSTPSEEPSHAGDNNAAPGNAGEGGSDGHVPRDGADKRRAQPGDATTPPESMFRLLQPSSNRYTLLPPRDEL